MAKKQTESTSENQQRQTRKDILKARKLSEQTRQVRIGVGIVASILLLIVLFGLINELAIQPNRPVADVRGETITLREWQQRVRYERAQLIILLENQLEAFNGDVGVIQQFSGQAITQLLDAEGFGQGVLDAMIDEQLIRQAAEARGITVTDEEVQTEFEAIYNYFGGDSPTPFPTPTQTIMPTPSITPIPTAVITEVLPTATPFPTPTAGPTSTPRPTATPVSLEAFQEQSGEFLAQLAEFGIDETLFLETIRTSIYRDKLVEALSEEEALATEAPHASFFVLSFDTEEEANEALAVVEAEGYLSAWNQIRSTPFDPESESTADATEVPWRSQETIEGTAFAEVAELVFELPLNEPSGIVVEELDEDNSRYYIVMVSGREIRPLSEGEYQQNQQELLTAFLASQTDVERTTNSLNRAPRQPVLDPLFLAPPTATPPAAGGS